MYDKKMEFSRVSCLDDLHDFALRKEESLIGHQNVLISSMNTLSFQIFFYKSPKFMNFLLRKNIKIFKFL